MHRLLFSTAVVLFFSAEYAVAQPAFKIETTDRQQVNASITYEIKMRNFAVTQWMIFLPEPPELPSQKDVKVKATPGGKVLSEKSLLERKVRYLELPVASPKRGTSVSMTLDISATLRSRNLVPLKPDEKPPVVAPLTANERKYYLSSTPHVDFDTKAFQNWLDAKKLRMGKTEDPLEFAARILEVIRADYTYNYAAEEDKRASITCQGAKTDCAGMSYLFVGAMRANNVPARLLVGRQAYPRKAGSNPGQTDYDHPHIRVEMFLTDIGWIPVEPAYAHHWKSRPISTYIGHDPGDMIVLHVDVDLKLPFPDKVRNSQFIQISPHYWTWGHGEFDGYFGPSGWEVRTTPTRER